MRKIYHRIIQIAGNVITVEADNVAYNDLAEVTTSRGTSLAQVIRLQDGKVSLQVFAGSRGISTGDEVRFLGHPMMVSSSEDLMGRIFTGAGKARDGRPDIEDQMIEIGGEDVTHLPEYKRAQYIGRVFQDPMMGTAATMQIEENLALAARRGKNRNLRIGITKAEREEYMEQLKILDLGLENRMTAKVGLLSGGQRQALTLLMATLQKPKLLLLDEHTAALDPKTAAKVLDVKTSSAGFTGNITSNDGAYIVVAEDGDIFVSNVNRGTLFVDSSFSGNFGDKVADGKYLGINAFATAKDAFVTANEVGGATIELGTVTDITSTNAQVDFAAGTYKVTGGDGDLLPGFFSQTNDNVIVNIENANVSVGKIIAGSSANKDTQNQYNIKNSVVNAGEYTPDGNDGAAWWTMWGDSSVTIENSVVGLQQDKSGTIDISETHRDSGKNAVETKFNVTYGEGNTRLNFGSAGNVTVKDSTLITGFFQVALCFISFLHPPHLSASREHS